MALKFSRPHKRLPLGVAAILAAGFAPFAHAQLNVEDFPHLELQDFSYVSAERIAGYQDEAKQRSIRPFKIFDNLYYVGIEWVSSFLIDTGDGLILIDSLHEPYIELAAEHIRELGFDPADVRYVVGVHGHFDHMGGHAYWQRTFGATVGLAAADWKRAQTDAGQEGFGMEVAGVDWIVQDGETLTLGDQTVTFYVTPGHTEGVLSMEFTVRDGDDEHRAVIYGGTNSLEADFWRYQTVLGNLRRFQLLAAQSPQFTVRLPTHPNGPGSVPGTGFFERRDRLAARTPGQPHPFVEAPGVFMDVLEQAERNVEAAILRLP